MNARIYLLAFFSWLVMGIAPASGQVFDWVRTFGHGSYIEVNDVVADGSGNFFVVGAFKGTMDFDPGPSVVNLTSAGYEDAFISKFTPAGNLLWVKHWGGIYIDIPHCIELGINGDLYIGGRFQDVVDFDPGAGMVLQSSIGSGQSAFVLRLNQAGVYQSVVTMPSDYACAVQSMTQDQQGNLVLSGVFSDSSLFLGTYLFGGLVDIFVAKMDTALSLGWVRSFGAIGGFETAGAVAVDASGGIYVTGRFQGTVDFDPGPGTTNLTSSAPYSDGYLSKFDGAGNWKWVRQFAGPQNEGGTCLVAADNRSIFVAGTFDQSIDLDPGPGTDIRASGSTGIDIFIVRLDTAGNYVWGHNFQGGSNSPIRQLDLDGASTIIAAGSFAGTVDFDPSPGGTAILSSMGATDGYVLRLDTAMQFEGVLQYGGPGYDNCIAAKHFGMAGLLIAGDFQQTVDFDPGPGTINMTAMGTEAAFIEKFRFCSHTSATITQASCDSLVSPSGRYTWSTSGTYLDTIPNVAGCDSFITATVTILQSTQSTLHDTACTQYLSPAGNIYTASGIYTEVIPNAVGCDSNITLHLWIWNLQASLSQSGLVLTANPPGALYQWMSCENGGFLIPGAIAQTFTPSGNGTFAAIVTMGGCSDTTSCTTVIVVEKEPGGVGAFAIHPNPATDKVVLEVPEVGAQQEARLLDVMGREMRRVRLDDTRTLIDLRGLPTATYFIQLDTGKCLRLMKSD